MDDISGVKSADRDMVFMTGLLESCICGAVGICWKRWRKSWKIEEYTMENASSLLCESSTENKFITIGEIMLILIW